jgi:tetratricopeptide (TPR) repeat protein
MEATFELLDPEPYPLWPGIGWSHEGPIDPKSKTFPPKFSLASNRYKFPGKPFARRDYIESKGVSSYENRYALHSTGPHRLRLKLWDNSAEICVDDAVWSTPPLKDKWDRSGFLCLGTNMETNLKGGALRLGRIRIRKIEVQPPPAESEPFAVRLAYWESRRMKNQEFDPVTMSRLCRLRFEQGQFEEVISLAGELLDNHPGISDVEVWKARAILIAHHDEEAALAILTECTRDSGRDAAEAMSTMAEIFAMARSDAIRDGKKAFGLAKLAVRISGEKHARSLAALAAAHAELGTFSGATDALSKAFEIASEAEKIEWEPRMAAYQAAMTYRYPEPVPNR